MFKGQKGITLIALVITIIVLLILAGVSIMMLSGADNAPDKAGEAVVRDALGGTKDTVNFAASNALLDFYNDKYVDNKSTAADAQTAVWNAIKDLTPEKVTPDAETGAASHKVKFTYTGGNAYVEAEVLAGGAIKWTDNLDTEYPKAAE